MQFSPHVRRRYALIVTLVLVAALNGCGTDPLSLDPPDTLPSTIVDPVADDYLITASEDPDSGAWKFAVQEKRPGTGGGQLSFVWDFGDGQTYAGTARSYSFAEPGWHTITVRAYDSQRREAFVLTLNLEIPALNEPPITVAQNQTVNESTLVYLDGSASEDAANDQLTFTWIQVSGPPVLLEDPTLPIARFVAPMVEIDTRLVFTLTVSDGVHSSETTVTVDVLNVIGAAGEGDYSCRFSVTLDDAGGSSDVVGQRPLTVVCAASITGLDASVGAELAWSFDGIIERGALDTHTITTPVFYTGGIHTIALSLLVAGVPIACQNTEDLQHQASAIVSPTVSGRVVDEWGNPLPGIVVAGNANATTAITDSGGYYKIHVPFDWSGVVTPQDARFAFSPREEVFEGVQSDLSSHDLTALTGATPVKEPCNSDESCDDGVYCNGYEGCVSGFCEDGPLPCISVDACDEELGRCKPCEEYCNDDVYCNGVETCVNDICQPGVPVDCNDGLACTDDSCNEAVDSCDNVSTCDDGEFCNGEETCDPVLGVCQTGSAPCPGLACDEASDTCGDCLESTTSWQNTSFGSQNGSFVVEFDAVPNDPNVDGIMALGAGPGTTFSAFAVLVRFNDAGRIDARNGGTYSAVTDMSYTPGSVYSFRLMINVPARTYSVFVTPQGSNEAVIAADYVFRTEQNTVTELNTWAHWAGNGSHSTCALTVTADGRPTAHAGPDQTLTDVDDNGSEQVGLDGTASSDSDGAIVSYRWTEGATVLYDGPSATTNVTFAVGTYTITLTVTGNDGNPSTDTVVVTVNAQPSGSALTPIARWDVVPYQRIDQDEPFNCGVVAFSKNGIQKVTFTISGQGYTGDSPIEVTEMALNERTNVWEYWTSIVANTFTSDGPITVEATVYGEDGGIRDKNTGGGGLGLDPLVLNVNPQGTLPQPEAWVDVRGDDDTGQVNNASLPFLSIHQAIESIRTWRNANGHGDNADGGIVRLNPGTHTTPASNYGDIAVANEWVTVTTSSGGTRANTSLAAGGIIRNVYKIAIKGITLDRSGGAGSIVYPSSAGSSMLLWVDDCNVIGRGKWFLDSHPVHGNVGLMYQTDSYITEVDYVGSRVRSGPLARSLTIEAIGNDVFVNKSMVVNVTANDVNPDIADIPAIVGATYYPTGHSSGHDYVIEKPGAFTNLVMPPANTTWYFMRNASNVDRRAIAGKIDDDAIYLTTGFSGGVTDGVISTTWHADAFQLWGGVTNNHDNIIVYNYRATNLNYQGIFARGRDGSPTNESPPDIQGAAFVNVYIEMTDTAPGASCWYRRVDHLLLWHSSFVNGTFNIYHDPFPGTLPWKVELSNFSVVGNMFHKMTLNHDDSGIDWSGTDNNHFEIDTGLMVITEGTNATTGDAQLDPFGRPEVLSPLVNRITPLLVSVDAGGTPREPTADVGAYEE